MLASAPDRRLTRGELNKKLNNRGAALVGLTPESASPVLELCSQKEYVQSNSVRRTVAYVLTAAGAAHLDTIRTLHPILNSPQSRGRVIPPANDQIRDYRASYLLLQVLKDPGQSPSETEANRQLDSYGRQGLELNAATALQVRQELVAQGFLTLSGAGRSLRYGITRAGRLKLGNAEFPVDPTFKLTGRTLNALLEAAREVGKQFAPLSVDASGSPDRAELEKAVLAECAELRREQYAVSGLVPIHEVRAEIRKRFGDASARHDVFDEVVLGLWREKAFRLTPIADHARATPQQLQDSIPGVGEVLFYLEAAHEPAAV
jgi:hypothetical protein